MRTSFCQSDRRVITARGTHHPSFVSSVTSLSVLRTACPTHTAVRCLTYTLSTFKPWHSEKRHSRYGFASRCVFLGLDVGVLDRVTATCRKWDPVDCVADKRGNISTNSGVRAPRDRHTSRETRTLDLFRTLSYPFPARFLIRQCMDSRLTGS